MKKLPISYALLTVFSMASSTAYAASQDECAIWICLPGGFPSGCSAAYYAMIDRIEDRKPPVLPENSYLMIFLTFFRIDVKLESSIIVTIKEDPEP